MAQMSVVSWTNAASVAVRNQSVGFTVNEAMVTNLTDGVQYYWNSAMPTASYVTVGTGAVTLTNGFTPLAQQTLVAAPITGISAASSAVVTASFLSQFSFAVGDLVKITDVADDSAADGDTTLNFTATVTAVSATTITVNVNTSSGYATYVSGGYISRIEDVNGVPIPIKNVAIRGITLGTGVVGGNSDSMVAVYHGDNVVV